MTEDELRKREHFANHHLQKGPTHSVAGDVYAEDMLTLIAEVRKLREIYIHERMMTLWSYDDMYNHLPWSEVPDTLKESYRTRAIDALNSK